MSYRPPSDQKTILDAIKEHEYLKPKPTKNPSIPRGGSIITPKPPQLKTYYTICDNGGRRIPSYYLGGRRVNALGFGLSDNDIKNIKKNKCTGCNGFRCVANQFASVSTDQPEVIFQPKKCPNEKIYPASSPYFSGPLPIGGRGPITIPVSDKEYGQLEDFYYLDHS